MLARQVGEVVGGDLACRPSACFGPPSATLPISMPLHALEEVVLEDALLVVEVLADPLDLGLLDRQRARCPSRRRRG